MSRAKNFFLVLLVFFTSSPIIAIGQPDAGIQVYKDVKSAVVSEKLPVELVGTLRFYVKNLLSNEKKDIAEAFSNKLIIDSATVVVTVNPPKMAWTIPAKDEKLTAEDKALLKKKFIEILKTVLTSAVPYRDGKAVPGKQRLLPPSKDVEDLIEVSTIDFGRKETKETLDYQWYSFDVVEPKHHWLLFSRFKFGGLFAGKCKPCEWYSFSNSFPCPCELPKPSCYLQYPSIYPSSPAVALAPPTLWTVQPLPKIPSLPVYPVHLATNLKPVRLPSIPTAGMKPEDAIRFYDTGYRQYWGGKYAEALASLTAGVDLAPNDARIWYYKALAEFEFGDTAAARASLEGAASAQVNNPDQNTDVIEALKDLQGPARELIAAKPDAIHLYDTGLRLYSTGNLSEAHACLSVTVKLAPDDARFWYYKALTEQSLGYAAAARTSVECAVAAQKRSPGQYTAVMDALKDVQGAPRALFATALEELTRR